ncbi:BTB domain-containing protein [Caenorhabditis elegans]|uniref:BTB domain-containing protein n=1 Tax=Caenorhabditis elegans TaxID=6239 RepID=P91557_CAEEL|nr:BTB domain-containing protein [Caenorhabditis elegans]CCD64931.1 BTB domain-containing protein [Caenorhabditis elegans]|eukprot:NP_494475.1 Uncharacterized protein CELE_ZC239.5 [Caenorhabditis elegans]
MGNNIIKLNVGGKEFSTTEATLTKFEGYFKQKLKTRGKIWQTTLFIDRSPTHFEIILNFMRDGKVDLPETLKELMPIFRETEYYTLASLVEQCGGAIASLGGGPEFDKFRGIIPTEAVVSINNSDVDNNQVEVGNYYVNYIRAATYDRFMKWKNSSKTEQYAEQEDTPSTMFWKIVLILCIYILCEYLVQKFRPQKSRQQKLFI